MRKTIAVAIGFLLHVCIGASAWAAPSNVQTNPFLPIGGQSRPPIGWVEFCRDRPWECRAELQVPVEFVMTPARWAELNDVNRRVNAEITPATDLEIYGRTEVWTYPVENRGDCEDYALLKRRRLIDLGWPESALLMTVVRDQQGDGHAVLMVRTSQGDVILDNVRDEVLPWFRTGYRYVKRQSQWAPNVWVSLPGDTGGRDTPVAARR